MKNNRIVYFDIAKGVGIILVVWAHARGPFSSPIYQFHMPFFFLISGLLYNDHSSFLGFTLRKIQSLYVPFVVWNIVFTGFRFLITGGSYGNLKKTVIEVLLTLSKDGQFLGPTWFLGALFVVSVSYKFLDAIILNKHSDLIIIGICLALTLYGFWITFPYKISRTMILSSYYAFGVLIRHHGKKIEKYNNIYAAIISAAFFAVISHFNSANMSTNEYRYPLLFLIGALFASYSVLYFCATLSRLRYPYIMITSKALVFIGKSSRDILIWHIFFFRVVIILQLIANNEPVTFANILKYYPVYDASHGWWFVYVIIGVTIPILWQFLLRQVTKNGIYLFSIKGHQIC